MSDPQLKPYAYGAKFHHESLNGSGYPEGLTKKNIPLEGQIIRVADEYDAIVSKRQYKTHIGITDTLKILIDNTKPTPKSIALKAIEENANVGKLNPKIVKKLFKVVIDDIEYEISCVFAYTKYLDEQIKRLETINEYNQKLMKTNKEKKKEYLRECMKILFEKDEDFRNYRYVLEEYQIAFLKRKEIINTLFDEIKRIKKLRV